jgi:hypothetical protein
MSRINPEANRKLVKIYTPRLNVSHTWLDGKFVENPDFEYSIQLGFDRRPSADFIISASLHRFWGHGPHPMGRHHAVEGYSAIVETLVQDGETTILRDDTEVLKLLASGLYCSMNRPVPEDLTIVPHLVGALAFPAH